MPEYLSPGVYVEEASFRPKSIEGVSTTTTGFVGPARYGPISQVPDVITSLVEFEQRYGDGRTLDFGAAISFSNFLWHAVRGFFTEGGKRLYVSRVFNPSNGADYAPPPITLAEDSRPALKGNQYTDGHARDFLHAAPPGSGNALEFRARFPGAAGNLRVRLNFRYSQNVVVNRNGTATVTALANRDLVLIDDIDGNHGALHLAKLDSNSGVWHFISLAGAVSALPDLDPASRRIRILTVDLGIQPPGTSQTEIIWKNLALDPAHIRAGVADSLLARFAPLPANDARACALPIEILAGDDLEDGLDLIRLLTDQTIGLLAGLQAPEANKAVLMYERILTGGNDGERPQLADYAGRTDTERNYRTGIRAFETIEDIAIVAAPGVTFGYENGHDKEAQAVINLLLEHCREMRYRIALIDCGDGQSVAEVRAMRVLFDSKFAAFYYPWVIVRDPITQQNLALPPSGFVAGIFARNDSERGVWKAPANEVVRSAIQFELTLSKSQQEVLNPEGINCFRAFEGRGMRLWGARTMSSDPEWKYVNVRRYFAYLERSIDKGTQWAVFEPNGEPLWANLRRTIEDFLLNEWQQGALLGDKPEKAYFVRCDRSSMTQNDLDNGRVICLIGVAPLKPAEFVIFRIGQWTADAKPPA
jgi:phage tail sheath protein FI